MFLALCLGGGVMYITSRHILGGALSLLTKLCSEIYGGGVTIFQEQQKLVCCAHIYFILMEGVVQK